MEIKIETQFLIDNNLTISEYIFLRHLYEGEENPDIYKIIDKLDMDTLQESGFIRILNSEIVLRKKALEIFEGKDLFEKFIGIFPIKTPSGRYLSPLGSNTIKAKEIKKKWKAKFKSNPHLEEKAIRVLEAEMKWRRESGSMEFIHNALTWLNQGDYENYEYLLDNHDEQYEDFM